MLCIKKLNFKNSNLKKHTRQNKLDRAKKKRKKCIVRGRIGKIIDEDSKGISEIEERNIRYLGETEICYNKEETNDLDVEFIEMTKTQEIEEINEEIENLSAVTENVEKDASKMIDQIGLINREYSGVDQRLSSTLNSDVDVYECELANNNNQKSLNNTICITEKIEKSENTLEDIERTYDNLRDQLVQQVKQLKELEEYYQRVYKNKQLKIKQLNSRMTELKQQKKMMITDNSNIKTKEEALDELHNLIKNEYKIDNKARGQRIRRLREMNLIDEKTFSSILNEHVKVKKEMIENSSDDKFKIPTIPLTATKNQTQSRPKLQATRRVNTNEKVDKQEEKSNNLLGVIKNKVNNLIGNINIINENNGINKTNEKQLSRSMEDMNKGVKGKETKENRLSTSVVGLDEMEEEERRLALESKLLDRKLEVAEKRKRLQKAERSLSYSENDSSLNSTRSSRRKEKKIMRNDFDDYSLDSSDNLSSTHINDTIEQLLTGGNEHENNNNMEYSFNIDDNNESYFNKITGENAASKSPDNDAKGRIEANSTKPKVGGQTELPDHAALLTKTILTQNPENNLTAPPNLVAVTQTSNNQNEKANDINIIETKQGTQIKDLTKEYITNNNPDSSTSISKTNNDKTRPGTSNIRNNTGTLTGINDKPGTSTMTGTEITGNDIVNDIKNKKGVSFSEAIKTAPETATQSRVDQYTYTIYLNEPVKTEEQCNIYLCHEIGKHKPNIKENDIVARFVSGKRISIKCSDEKIADYILEQWPEEAFRKYKGIDRIEIYDGTTRWLLAFVNHIMTNQEHEWLKDKYNITSIEKVGAKEYKLVCADSVNYNSMLEAGQIKAGYAIIKVRAWTSKPVVERCYFCQRWGHIYAQCPRNKNLGPVCKYCSMNHDTRNCKRSEIPEWYVCVNCNGNHPASSIKCPKYIEIVNRIANKGKEQRTNGQSSVDNQKEKTNDTITLNRNNPDYEKKLEEYKKKIDTRLAKAVVMCTEVSKNKSKCPNIEKLTDDFLNTSLGAEMTELKRQLNAL
jgi:hypothetical protein